MDLPTCPACGQSVLEDDAVNCPFCGASMSGKPGKSAPPPPPKTSPKPPAGTTAGPKPATPPPAESKPGKPAPAKKQSDVDPFELASSANVAQAIPASPNPAKDKSLKVVCPMCETVGYVSTNAAGRNVKCANPACLVPVFTAPQIQKAVVPEAPKPEPKGYGKMLAAGVVALLLVGGGLFYMLRKPPEVKVDAFISDADVQKRAAQKEDTDEDAAPTTAAQPAPAQPKELTPAEIQKQALVAMNAASQQEQANRSKPFCRRLTAEAFAVTGDLKEARRQIERLEVVGAEVPYYQVTPWVAVAWKESEAKNSTEVATALDKALKAAKRLPQVGRTTLDAATELAAALAAAGRMDDAVTMIQEHQSPENVGRESAALKIAEAKRLYDLDADWVDTDLAGWSAPQWVAAAAVLASHGQWEPALQFAQRAPNAEVQSDCLAEWADVLTLDLHPAKGLDGLTKRVDDASKQMGPAVKARMLSRAARRQAALGDQAGAKKLLAEAVATLGTVEQPKPYRAPDSLKAVSEAAPPEVHQAATTARAAIEIARAQLALGQVDEARKSIEQGTTFARAIAPTMAELKPALDEIENDFSGLQKRFRTELKLKSDDEARLKANDYRQKFKQIAAAADARRQLQASMYQAVAAGPLLEDIWKDIKARQNSQHAPEREAFFETVLPDVLLERAPETKADGVKAAILAEARNDKNTLNLVYQVRQANSDLLAKGEWEKAADMVENVQLDKDWKSLWAMRAACRIQKTKGAPAAMEFARAFKDLVLREDVMCASAALAAKTGAAASVLEQAKTLKFTPTELVAAYRGVIAGLANGTGAAEPPQSAPVATSAEK